MIAFDTDVLTEILLGHATFVARASAIHGGYGYMMEYPVQRYFRDAKMFTITEGTSEIQQVVIARELGL